MALQVAGALPARALQPRATPGGHRRTPELSKPSLSALLAIGSAFQALQGRAGTRGATRGKVTTCAAKEQTVSRRSLSVLGLVPTAANAEEVIKAAPMNLQRVVVDVGNNEGMEKELKFWIKACQMKVLSDTTGADGFRTVTVGYASEKDDGSFAIEIKEDPSVLKRKRPSTLNFSVMQPTVNALNFTQISQPDQIFDMYARVEDTGGTSLVGDARYLDCESPRGVQVRMVPREGPPSVELVSLNIEVPAFEATKKFYERIGSLEETAYNEAEEAPIQKFSVFLKSRVGGPKLLLCPVPDGRLKQRDRDEFVNLVMLAPNAQQTAEAADKAILLAKEEEKKKDEEERERLRLNGKNPDEYERRGTQARPTVEMVGDDARINDGVGNIVVITNSAPFKSALPA